MFVKDQNAWNHHMAILRRIIGSAKSLVVTQKKTHFCGHAIKGAKSRFVHLNLA